MGDTGQGDRGRHPTDFLDKAPHASAADAQLTNVTFVLGTETDPKLPAGTVGRWSWCWMSIIISTIRTRMLSHIRDSLLKPDGRLAIVEYYKRAERWAS